MIRLAAAAAAAAVLLVWRGLHRDCGIRGCEHWAGDDD